MGRIGSDLMSKAIGNSEQLRFNQSMIRSQRYEISCIIQNFHFPPILRHFEANAPNESKWLSMIQLTGRKWPNKHVFRLIA